MADLRRYLLGSLLGHFGFLVMASVVGSVFVRTPPGLRVMRLDLQSLELPATEPVVDSAPESVAEPIAEDPPAIPEAPAELPLRRPPLEVESRPEEVDQFAEADLRAPDPLLPREPAPTPEEPVDLVEERSDEVDEPIDLPEPSDVTASESNPTGASGEVEELSAAPATQLADGGAVQASSTEGVSDFYLARVQQKIGRRWRPTPASAAGLQHAECLVHFRIGPTGEVIAPSVARSSGLSVFDRQALRAVLESSPMPELPPRFARSGVEIRFLFSYEQ